MVQCIHACRRELRLAVLAAIAPSVSGRYIRRFRGFAAPFLILTAVQASLFEWHLGHQSLIRHVPWVHALTLFVPMKTALTIGLAALFLTGVSRLLGRPLDLGKSASMLLRCAYVFAVAEILVTAAGALLSPGPTDLQPLEVPGIATIVRVTGLAGRIVNEFTVASIWYGIALVGMIKGMNHGAWRGTLVAGGTTWFFVILCRVAMQLIVEGIRP
jgi:hypothetical protein